MNRDQKAAKIEEIAAQIEGAESIFAVNYRGISVPQAAELRSKLREVDASFWVVKNRLTKLAAEKVGEERLGEWLEGPTALTFVRGDTAMAAKAISSFNKEHEVLTFKGGFMDSLSLDEERFNSIARLPAREVLDGQLAGIVASPLTGLVRGLGSMIQGLALQLGQIADKGLVSGAAPAGPVAESDDSSSQAAGESPDSTPPADEASSDEKAEEADPTPPVDDASSDEKAEEGDGPADAPVEEAPTEASSGNEPPAEGDPSQAEGDEGDAEPAAEASDGDETSSDEETSNDDESEDEE
jgi:large subunit ribosomal protein L10